MTLNVIHCGFSWIINCIISVPNPNSNMRSLSWRQKLICSVLRLCTKHQQPLAINHRYISLSLCSSLVCWRSKLDYLNQMQRVVEFSFGGKKQLNLKIEAKGRVNSQSALNMHEVWAIGISAIHTWVLVTTSQNKAFSHWNIHAKKNFPFLAGKT